MAAPPFIPKMAAPLLPKKAAYNPSSGGQHEMDNPAGGKYMEEQYKSWMRKEAIDFPMTYDKMANTKYMTQVPTDYGRTNTDHIPLSLDEQSWLKDFIRRTSPKLTYQETYGSGKFEWRTIAFQRYSTRRIIILHALLNVNKYRDFHEQARVDAKKEKKPKMALHCVCIEDPQKRIPDSLALVVADDSANLLPSNAMFCVHDLGSLDDLKPSQFNKELEWEQYAPLHNGRPWYNSRFCQCNEAARCAHPGLKEVTSRLQDHFAGLAGLVSYGSWKLMKKDQKEKNNDPFHKTIAELARM